MTEAAASNQQTLEDLQRELMELESTLQSAQQQRLEREQEVAAELEREREAYRQEQIELARRQEMILQHGRIDPFWWADGGYLGGE